MRSGGSASGDKSAPRITQVAQLYREAETVLAAAMLTDHRQVRFRKYSVG